MDRNVREAVSIEGKRRYFNRGSTSALDCLINGNVCNNKISEAKYTEASTTLENSLKLNIIYLEISKYAHAKYPQAIKIISRNQISISTMISSIYNMWRI